MPVHSDEVDFIQLISCSDVTVNNKGVYDWISSQSVVL
jgi:hypothetical protein